MGVLKMIKASNVQSYCVAMKEVEEMLHPLRAYLR
jgi:hypothetical protein